VPHLRQVGAVVDGRVGARGRPVLGVFAQVHLRRVLCFEPVRAPAEVLGRLDFLVPEDVDQEGGFGSDPSWGHAQVHVVMAGHAAETIDPLVPMSSAVGTTSTDGARRTPGGARRLGRRWSTRAVVSERRDVERTTWLVRG